ncbi:hypothetical protein B0T14DRAFT_388969, partial [Immersiella caudata]
MNRRHNECRSEGCGGEVVFKTVDGSFVDSARGMRTSPNGYHRHSVGPTQIMSAYCKQHTCLHFVREEGCNSKKPPHDSVCPVHARCPVQDCNQARGQYLDTKFEYVPGSVPKYARYELCFDHECHTDGCRTIVEGDYPFCVIRKSSWSRLPKPLLSELQTSNGCAEPSCESAKTWAGKQKSASKFCPVHTCRSIGCSQLVGPLALFCNVH